MQRLVLKSNRKPTESKVMSYKHEKTAVQKTYPLENTSTGWFVHPHLKHVTISRICKLFHSKWMTENKRMAYIHLFQPKSCMQWHFYSHCPSLYPWSTVHLSLSTDLLGKSWVSRFFAVTYVMLISPQKGVPHWLEWYLNIHFHSLGQWDVNQLHSKVVCCLVKRSMSAHRDQPRKVTYHILQPRQHVSLSTNRRVKRKEFSLQVFQCFFP